MKLDTETQHDSTAATDYRFCTSCQTYRDTEGGVYRKLKSSGRWICKPCITHTTESIYKNRSGRTANVKLIMKNLYAAQAAKGQG